MLPKKTKDEIAGDLNALLREKPRTLFAGSGIGVPLGFPDWVGYINLLAAVCDSNGDPASATLIRDRAKKGHLIGAASVYKTAETLPVGLMWEKLAEPFNKSLDDKSLSKVSPLIAIPFAAVVTTNYDRSLLDAYAKEYGRAPMTIENTDGTLKTAAFRRGHFIARIHGRAELPTSMVVDSSDYARVISDPTYLDFVLDLLKSKACIFVGFSFVDPAIGTILKIYSDRVGPHFPELHIAILPADADPKLVDLLRQVNIRVLAYDPKDGHADLWDALEALNKMLKQAAITATPPTAPPSPQKADLHRFLAFAYSQLHSQREQEPLQTVVQDGIIAAAIAEAGDAGATIEKLSGEVKKSLNLDAADAVKLSKESITRLVENGTAATKGDVAFLKKSHPEFLDRHVKDLAEAAMDRARVRDGTKGNPALLSLVMRVLEEVFTARAWDVAAHFAGAAVEVPRDIELLIKQSVARHRQSDVELAAAESVARSILDLVLSPGDSESVLLAELGRTAFAVQLVLASPRQSLLADSALPERVYLDANVAMPASTHGHPFRPIYMETIGSLAEAASRTKKSLRIEVGAPFLNEIVSHRRLAIDLARELKLDDPDSLFKHITFMGATNTNVFVGSFASFVGRKKKAPFKFGEYLNKYAPYTSEEQLAKFLLTMGIGTAARIDRLKIPQYSEVLIALRQGYESAHESTGSGFKDPILVEHEAEQLAQLRADISSGIRSVFVTSDNRLRSAIAHTPKLRDIGGCIVSHLGLVALVDFMVGLKPDGRSLARLIWAIPRTSEEEAVRSYLVDRALQQYDAALAMAAQPLVDELTENAVRAAKAEKISLLRSKSGEDAARAARFIDNFEQDFYKKMKIEIERKEAQSSSSEPTRPKRKK